MRKLSVLVFLFMLLFSNSSNAAYAPPEVPAVGASVCFPVLQYHRLSANPEKRSRYVITPGDLEEDLRFLNRMGYTGVTVSDLRDRSAMPERPVMLTFDDGYESDYTHVFPLLKKYNMKAVFFVIGKYADIYSANAEKDPSFARLDWAQMKEMKASGFADFQCHTYDLHDSDVLRRPEETYESYEERIHEDFKLFNKKFNYHMNAVPSAVASPFGLVDGDLSRAAENFGYSEVYGIGRLCRTDEVSAEELITGTLETVRK